MKFTLTPEQLEQLKTEAADQGMKVEAFLSFIIDEHLKSPLIPEKNGPPFHLRRFFAYSHLPEKLQAISKPLGDLADFLDAVLPDGSEKDAGMRKLLEAKDCFVRANLPPL